MNRKWALMPVAVVAASGGLGVSTGRFDGAAIAAALADPQSLLAARSPGARPDGALTQTKPRRVAGTAKDVPGFGLLPRERVLTNVRTRPESPDIATGTIPLPPLVSAFGPFPGIGLGEGGGPTRPVIVPPFFGGGFVPGAPGTGGGGGGGGGVIVTPTVPEPATWVTMAFGFFAIGSSIRRRRVADRRDAGAGRA